MAENAPTPDEKKVIDARGEDNLEEEIVDSKLTLLQRFRPLLIISVIIMAECIAAFFFAPSGTPVFADGDLSPEQLITLQKADLATQEEKIKEKEEKEAIPGIEIDMGEFSITYASKSEGATTQANFHLFGVVAYSNESGFIALFEEKENRLRDLVRSIIRESEISELSTPGLALIKRQILEKVNRELGKPMLQEVVFSDWSLLER